MALEGTLGEFGLADILQLIYFQKKTGILKVASPTDIVKLRLLDGNIIDIESKRRLNESRIGKILIKKGFITEDNLNVAMQIQEEEKVKLGIIFLRRGLVPQDILTETIKGQITEAMAQVFSWTEGNYEFVPMEISQDSELPISIDTQHLLMDGLRTVDEWSHIEGRLELGTVYQLAGDTEGLKLDQIENDLLNMIDGISDVSTLISVSSYGDFETSRALISLEEKGVISPVTFKPPEVEERLAFKLAQKPVIIAIYAVSVLLVMFSLKGFYDSIGALRQLKNLTQIESIKRDIDIYAIKSGDYPSNIQSVTTAEDPWGRPFMYRLEDNGFVLYSKGKDGIEGTEDDVY